MNLTDNTDDEILAFAVPMWADLVKYSNEENYGPFTRDFAHELKHNASEVAVGRQFAKSQLTKNLSTEIDYLGMIRRGEHVTVLFKQTNLEMPGEWLGRLVLGYEEDEVKIFAATIF